MKEKELELTDEDIELQLLLEAIYLKHGYDFRDYARTSLKRQVTHRLSLSGLSNFLEMQNKVLYDPRFFDILLQDLSINFSEMFRDPPFYRAFKQQVIPVLHTYPTLKIWHAGCATGEEVYSLAILLKEEGLYDRAQIYATDFNDAILQQAKEGVYSIDCVPKYTASYKESGGKGSFDQYYKTRPGSMVIDPALTAHVVFAHHDLVTEKAFDEMHVIFCRNVMVYFNERLQYRVFRLFYDSLYPDGFLCLGSYEHIRYSLYRDYFEDVVREERIYKRKKRPWSV